MIINHNCCIKLVPLVIFIYDVQSHIHQFQEHFHEYKIIVYEGLNCDGIMFEGQVQSSKRLLLYDGVTRQYHVISLAGAMAKRYVCQACNKGCRNDVTHKCDQTRSDC